MYASTPVCFLIAEVAWLASLISFHIDFPALMDCALNCEEE